MHRAHTCHGLSQAFSCPVIIRNYTFRHPPQLGRRSIQSRTPSYPSRLKCGSIERKEDSKDGQNTPRPSTQQPNEAAEDEATGPSSSLRDARFDPETKKWIDIWPTSGSKKYSPTFAHQILPLIEATPDDPRGQKAEQPDRLEEVLTEPARPRGRSYRNIPNRRDILPPSFRKALLGETIEKKNSSPAWSQTRKVLPRHMRSTELLEQELQLIAHGHPHPAPVRNILNILIADRLVAVSSRHYEALILGNCHPETGSIESVHSILQEMFREGLPIPPAIAFAVIKVLSVHPDSLLRAYITQLMESQWVTIPHDVTQLMIVAMIREDQLELAQAEMDKVHEKGLVLPDWIWTIFIHALCDRHDFEAILQLFYTLSDQGRMVTRPTLLHVLEHASSVMERDLTKYIWRFYVESMHIIPDEALCMKVMAVAAHYNDLTLAESVAIVLQNVTTSTVSASLEQASDSDNGHELAPSSFELSDLTDRSHSEKLEHAIDFQGAEEYGSHAQQGPGSDAFDANVARSPRSIEERKASAESNAPVFKNASQARTFAREPKATSIRQIPHPRELPTKAQALLDSVRAAHNQSTKDPKHYRLGNLFPLFREDMGLRDARFDPRLALQRRQDWWLQPVPSKSKKYTSPSRKSKPRRG